VPLLEPSLGLGSILRTADIKADGLDRRREEGRRRQGACLVGFLSCVLCETHRMLGTIGEGTVHTIALRGRAMHGGDAREMRDLSRMRREAPPPPARPGRRRPRTAARPGPGGRRVGARRGAAFTVHRPGHGALRACPVGDAQAGWRVK
jgi:hypothetical protein